MLLVGVALMSSPPAVAAQAIGTLQVTARVQQAPSAWPVLAATASLAARTDVRDSAFAVNVGLARLSQEEAASDQRALRLRIDYLRN